MAQTKETKSREHKQKTGAKQQEEKNNSNTVHTTHTHPQLPIPVPYTNPSSCTDASKASAGACWYSALMMMQTKCLQLTQNPQIPAMFVIDINPEMA
jgi:hypothetical protein